MSEVTKVTTKCIFQEPQKGDYFNKGYVRCNSRECRLWSLPSNAFDRHTKSKNLGGGVHADIKMPYTCNIGGNVEGCTSFEENPNPETVDIDPFADFRPKPF